MLKTPILQAAPKQKSPLVEGILSPGDVLSLQAPAMTRKSVLSHLLVASVAGGKPFLGHQTKQARVAYLDRETATVDAMAQRVRLFSRGLELDANEVEDSILFGPLRDRGHNRAQLSLALCANQGLGVIVLDGFTRGIGSNPREADFFGDWSKGLAMRLDVGVVVIDYVKVSPRQTTPVGTDGVPLLSQFGSFDIVDPPRYADRAIVDRYRWV